MLNSWATLVSGLRLYRPTIVACFLFGGKMAAASFGTFATVSARSRHADCVAQCPLSGAKRKTFSLTELFRFGPKAEIGSHGFCEANGEHFGPRSATANC